MPSLLDVIVLVVVLISALLAMVRGFVREVLTLVSWVAAAGAAYLLYKLLLPLVKSFLSNTTVATIVSAAAIFLLALIVVSFLSMKIADFVLDSRVGAIDRGARFPLRRGARPAADGGGAGFLPVAGADDAKLDGTGQEQAYAGVPGHPVDGRPASGSRGLHEEGVQRPRQRLPARRRTNRRLTPVRPIPNPGPNDASRQQLNRLIENGGN